MKTLVTGAAGFIGTHLVERLRADGHEVVAVDIDEVDVLSPAQVAACMEEHLPDVVFHLAGQSDVVRSWAEPAYDAQLNLTGSLNMWEASEAVGVREFVFPASWTVYRPSPFLLTESDPWEPTTPYGVSKAAAATALRLLAAKTKSGPRVDVLMLGNVYGPGGENVVTSFARQAVEPGREALKAPLTVGRDFVHVDDVVDALVRVGFRSTGPGQCWNVGNGRSVKLSEVAAAVIRATGSPVSLVPFVGDHEYVALDCRQIREMLGWRPSVTFGEGVKALVTGMVAAPG